jgi:hypothetical protein
MHLLVDKDNIVVDVSENEIIPTELGFVVDGSYYIDTNLQIKYTTNADIEIDDLFEEQ